LAEFFTILIPKQNICTYCVLPKSQQALSATQNSAQSVENIHSNKLNKLITLLLTKLRFGYAADKTTV
jgi:hypothetical protein